MYSIFRNIDIRRFPEDDSGERKATIG